MFSMYDSVSVIAGKAELLGSVIGMIGDKEGNIRYTIYIDFLDVIITDVAEKQMNKHAIVYGGTKY